jgi:hypothetical protein
MPIIPQLLFLYGHLISKTQRRQEEPEDCLAIVLLRTFDGRKQDEQPNYFRPETALSAAAAT